MPEPLKVEIVETNPASSESKAPVAQVAQKEEPKYVKIEDLEKINQSIKNTREYNDRKLNELGEKLDRLIPKPKEAVPDDLDEIVQKDWKLGVRKVVEGVLNEQTSRVNAETSAQADDRIRKDSLSKVVLRHKELTDSSSEKYAEFQKVLAENPDFVTNPRGPLLTMYEMENRLNARGNIDSREAGDKVNKETRSRAASIPSGTSPSQKSYSLNKQDLDFCKLNGINPENYKRLKGQREVSA